MAPCLIFCLVYWPVLREPFGTQLLLENNESEARELIKIQQLTANQLLMKNKTKADLLKAKYTMKGEDNVLENQTAAKLLESNESDARELLENNESDARELIKLRQGMARALLKKNQDEVIKNEDIRLI